MGKCKNSEDKGVNAQTLRQAVVQHDILLLLSSIISRASFGDMPQRSRQRQRLALAMFPTSGKNDNMLSAVTVEKNNTFFNSNFLCQQHKFAICCRPKQGQFSNNIDKAAKPVRWKDIFFFTNAL